MLAGSIFNTIYRRRCQDPFQVQQRLLVFNCRVRYFSKNGLALLLVIMHRRSMYHLNATSGSTQWPLFCVCLCGMH